MRRKLVSPRHTPACVALALAGCYVGNPRDAGAPMPEGDGAACELRPARARSLECPSSAPRGERALARAIYASGGCPVSGPGRITVAGGGHTWSLGAELQHCACEHEPCPCNELAETVEVAIGPLVPGRHVVHFGEASCAIEVEGPAPAPECGLAPFDEVLAPRALLPGQRPAMTLRRRSGRGCGCVPGAVEVDSAMELAVCDCCELCACADPGYEVGWIGEAGRDVRVERRSIPRVQSSACSPIEPAGLRVIAPDPSRTSGGPRIHWAVIEASSCVDDPVAVVDDRDASSLRLAVCGNHNEDCERPRSFETFHALGELPAGEHVVRAGRFVERFVVAP